MGLFFPTLAIMRCDMAWWVLWVTLITGGFMRIRYVVAVSFGFKVAIVVLCASLAFVNGLLGANYFNPSLSASQYQSLVQKAANVDSRNQFGDTGLMYAAAQGILPLAKALVKNGAHLNLQSVQGSYTGLAGKINGQTALHYVIPNIRLQRNKDLAYYLINQYADPRITNAQQDTPLHLTVASTDVIPDRTAMVVALVKNGAPINAQNFQGSTLMHFAANSKSPEWIRGIKKNLGPLINMKLKNKKGFTPYEFAVRLGFQDTSEALKEPLPAMPKANEYNPAGLTGLMLAVMKGDQKLITQMADTAQARDMKSRDEYQNSALHYAMIFDRIAALKTLLQKGASPAIANARGETPIHFLPRISIPKKQILDAKLFLNKNPQLILSKNKKGDNLLHYVVRYDTPELLDFLIKNYHDITRNAVLAANNALITPIQLADRMRRRQIGQRLRALRQEGSTNKK